MTSAPDDLRWLARFHAGSRAVLGEVYLEHYETVERAVRGLVSGADRETVIHEVFFRLLANEGLRRSFDGRALGAWLATVARNHAGDYLRHHRREQASGIEPGPEAATAPFAEAAEAHLLVERFRREFLPAKWQAVFEVRFLRQLPQREAAAALGTHRTTLAYQELRIRQLLRRFFLGEGR